jgi:hypothetical protein
MVVLVGFLGMAIDTGYIEYVKVRMQTAADAAALGGVQELRLSGTANVATAAKADAATNGFTDGAASVVVQVNNPPASGYYTADRTGVEVIITQDVGTFFMGALHISTAGVRARAVARQGPGTDCLYALDPAASNALSASGGVAVQVNCGIIVDSSSATALSANGGAHVTATSIDVTGNYSLSGGAVLTPSPVTGVAAQSDPLSYVTAPVVGACNFTSYSLSGGATATINPGVYCKGISISGGSNLTLNAGTYILKGGGLSLSGGAIISGTGVTFYNTAGGGNSYGAISISGGTTVHLTAPTTGPLAAMLFFEDRSIVGGAASSLSGGASVVFNGALYFPTTALSYSGGTGGTYTIIVAKTVSFSGGATVNSDYTSLPGGTPVRGGAALSE